MARFHLLTNRIAWWPGGQGLAATRNLLTARDHQFDACWRMREGERGRGESWFWKHPAMNGGILKNNTLRKCIKCWCSVPARELLSGVWNLLFSGTLAEGSFHFASPQSSYSPSKLHTLTCSLMATLAPINSQPFSPNARSNAATWQGEFLYKPMTFILKAQSPSVASQSSVYQVRVHCALHTYYSRCVCLSNGHMLSWQRTQSPLPGRCEPLAQFFWIIIVMKLICTAWILWWSCSNLPYVALGTKL